MPSDQWAFLRQDDAMETFGLAECAEQDAMHIVEDPWPAQEVDRLANRPTEEVPKWHTDHQEDLTKMFMQQHYLP